MPSLASSSASLAALALLSCQAPSEVARTAEVAGPAVYVGTADEPDADVSIALAVQGDHVAAYACGSDPEDERYPGWFTRTPYDGDGWIVLDRDGWSVDVRWTSASADGTLTGPDGASLGWSGTRARTEEAEGLYTAFDSGCTTGVIVIDDGSATSPLVRGAWCNAAGAVEQVTPLRPVELVDGRLRVEVELGTGTRRFDVAPIRLPLTKPGEQPSDG